MQTELLSNIACCTLLSVRCYVCGTGVIALSSAAVMAVSKHKNDTTITTETPTTALNVSTLTTEVTSTGTLLPPTTVAPPNDIWTVKFPNSTRMCILLSANITLTYNDGKEVMNESVLLHCSILIFGLG